MIHLRSSSVNVALKISDAPLIVLFQQGLARVGFMCIAEGDAAAVLILVLGRSTRAASCSRVASKAQAVRHVGLFCSEGTYIQAVRRSEMSWAQRLSVGRARRGRGGD